MDSSIQTQAQPLTSRSTNTHLSQQSTMQFDAKKQADIDVKPATNADLHSMDYHRKTLQDKLQNGVADDQSNNASYVSPSDDIMSPCTKKLSDLKGKRFKNAGKPTSLFAKLGKKNYEQSTSSSSSASPATEAE
ncbi:hypothetical protein TMatcc_007542 [Talaromyces marneffei ATCC 18224]|uniref:Spo12 family protein n=2 Tax=Talaromyces marneffei TaxID=37727 RepID=B6QG56_TALMQ|nr:uncharacterized protein EYB26_004490 [Talaromyces marneffei]EEA24441.1 conserved hypothetical protein [Talaromyces marneffei ATCC 18224]EEA24442.1 conserved hypothetical protein [Talaromyces marneffei ATCC 18224]KAE8553049.1 hypothetical protein EYB25_004428 [Talaromyces marneffei]QGA16820.1 hypothetical protein EYB26_004490 [Talaromyces marneffei]